MVNKFTLPSIMALLYAIIIIVMMQPYYLWGMNLQPIIYLSSLIGLCYLRPNSNKEIGLFVFFVMVMLIYPITHGSSDVLRYIFLAFIPFLAKDFIKESYKFFSIIYISVLSISAVVWLMVVLGFAGLLPSQVIEPLNELKNYNYTAYPFLVLPLDMLNPFEAIRFGSVFDEPGVVGTINLVMLFINKFDFKKVNNVILLITGFFSLSLFFIGGLAIYGGLKYFLGKSKLKNKIALLAVAAGVIIALLYVPVLHDYFGYRLEYDKDTQSFVGNTRSNTGVTQYFNSIRGTSKYFWGDDPKVVKLYEDEANYKIAILRFGAVFCFLYIVFFILYFKKSTKASAYETLVFATLVVITLYQRPGFINYEFVFLFTSYIKTTGIKKREYVVKKNTQGLCSSKT